MVNVKTDTFSSYTFLLLWILLIQISVNMDLFSKQPRGIKNNNWLNIKFNPKSKWLGLAGNDGTFCIFKKPEYGIRAAHKILRNYVKSDSSITLERMIYKWCPDKTAMSYTAYIIRHSFAYYNTLLSDILNDFNLFLSVVVSMCEVECGQSVIRSISGYKTIISHGLSMKL